MRFFSIVGRRKGKGLKAKEMPTYVSVCESGQKKPKTFVLKEHQADFDFCWFGIPTAFKQPNPEVPVVFLDKDTTEEGLLPPHLYRWDEYTSLGAVPEGTPEWMRYVVKKNDVRVLAGIPTEFLKIQAGDAVLMQYGGGDDAFAQGVRLHALQVGVTVYRTPSLLRDFKKEFFKSGADDAPDEELANEKDNAADAATGKQEAAFLAGELRKFLAGEPTRISIYEMIEAETLIESIQYTLNQYTAAQVERIKRGNYLFALARRQMHQSTVYRIIKDEFEAMKAADRVHCDGVACEEQFFADLKSLVQQHPFYDVLKDDADLSRGIGPVIMAGIIAMTGGNISRYDLPVSPERAEKIAEAKRLRDECLASACGGRSLNERVMETHAAMQAAGGTERALRAQGAGSAMRITAHDSATGQEALMSVVQRIAYVLRFLETQDAEDADIPVLKDALRHARRLTRLRSRKRQIVARLESNAGLKCLGPEVPAYERWPKNLSFTRRFWKTCFYLMDQIQRGTNASYREVMDRQFERFSALHPEPTTVMVTTKAGKTKERTFNHPAHLKRKARRKAMVKMMRRVFRKMVDTLLPKADAEQSSLEDAA